jgi:hypothetical protein
MNENIEATRAASETAKGQAAAPAFPVNPAAAAAAIVAYYPELVDLDTSTQTKVQGYIHNAGGFQQLKDSISAQGKSNWAPPTPIILENGQPAKDPQGNAINQLMLSEQTTTDMVTPVAEALCGVRTDPSLENLLWTTQRGIAPGGSADNAAAPASTRWTLREVAPRYGVTVPSLSFDYSDNTFQLQLTNEYARHLAVYVEFMAAGEVMTPSQWTSRLPAQLPASFETDTLKYLGVLGPTNHVAGMKMTTGLANFSFSLPAGATAARLLFGGLGAQPSGSVVEAVGTILTAIMDQAIPAILLTAQESQSGTDPSTWFNSVSTWFNSVLADADLINEVIAASGFLISGQASTLVTKVPVLLLGTSLPNLAANIGKNVGAAAIGNAAPYLGWAAQGMGALRSPNALAQTVSWLLATPATFALDLSPTMAANVSLTVLPDPARDEWPDDAARYSVTATFSGGLNRQAAGEMPAASTTAPLLLTFPDAPMDEGVAVNVSIYARNKRLCGSGQTVATISKATGSATFEFSLNISDYRVPLSADTQYGHKRKLVYDTASQQHVWQMGPAPRAVWSGSNDCAGSGNVLCQLTGITLNEQARMLGYGWQASGQGLSPCGQPSAAGGQLYAFQNIGLPDPQAALKFPTCGFLLPSGLIYQRSGPDDEPADDNVYNFYLDSQTVAPGAAYQLRGVKLDAQTPFNLSQTESWGAFVETALTAFVVHPVGYVIGVSYGSSKMEILQLPAGPVADANAPTAFLTSGRGALPGLLKGPIAIGVTGDGVLLVLEQDNQRIQAFDVYGNPVPYFPNNSPFTPLQTETSSPTYLDMSVTDDGWIYVLSHVNTGSTQSDYRLDIYTPAGVFLSRTVGVNGAKIVADSWRRVYTLNYESFLGPAGRTEPSVSQWIPS